MKVEDDIQLQIEERYKMIALLRQRIENHTKFSLSMIDDIMRQIRDLNCDEEDFMPLLIDRCFEIDSKVFFDKYLLHRTCEIVMKRGGVVYRFQGELDYKCYRLLMTHYTPQWLYKVPIDIVRKLAISYPGVRTNVLPIREKKNFPLNWDWVKFYNGYLEITQPVNSDGIIFNKYKFYSASLTSHFNTIITSMINQLVTISCTSCMRQLRLDDDALALNISKLRGEYEQKYRMNNSGKYSGGSGWGPKSGTEMVCEHNRSGHWRHLKSGKKVWIRACIVSKHFRTY